MPEKKVSKKKATKNEIETRISEIIKLILEGKSNHSIMLYSIQKYSIGKPQAYENIREAHKRLSQIYHTNIYSNYVKSISFHQEGVQEIYNEIRALKEIEAKKAKDRQSHGLTAPGKTLTENLPQALKRFLSSIRYTKTNK